MSYLNTATAKPRGPPAIDTNDPHLTTPVEEYDLNYVYPVKVLETHAVRIEPFIPSLHIDDTVKAWSLDASIFKYMPFDAPATLTESLGRLEWLRCMPDRCLLAIIDKQSNDRNLLAGSISLANTDTANLSVEFAPVIIYPEFQRTHVLTHAISLLLHYLFEDLGLRRVQWSADQQHKGSIAAATRLGFKEEGVLEWHRVLPSNKAGLEINASEKLGTPSAGPGRHSVILGLTWEAWKNGVKNKIEGLVAREVVRH